ncbi:MAG: rhodanese-like domain-containing protein [Flavobacteriales bacterium]|nr:rhodanese-like domain-containing protein [Flavobacteriales bacterium]
MKTIPTIMMLLLGAVACAQPEAQKHTPSDVDYPGFVELTAEAEEHRKTHTVSLEDFIRLSKEKGTMILDTRSEKMYKAKHVKGAVHLNFSDFTADKLAKVIPSKDTRVLIYCNNNLDKDPYYFARKSAPLALNIPTFINLYGYGYKNVYELNALVPVVPDLGEKGPALEFEGTAVEASSTVKSKAE